MECYTYLRNIHRSTCLMGRLHTNDGLEQPFKGPIIPFGSLVEYYILSTAKDQSRIHQLGKKVLPGLFLGYASVRGENLEG